MRLVSSVTDYRGTGKMVDATLPEGLVETTRQITDITAMVTVRLLTSMQEKEYTKLYVRGTNIDIKPEDYMTWSEDTVLWSPGDSVSKEIELELLRET